MMRTYILNQKSRISVLRDITKREQRTGNICSLAWGTSLFSLVLTFQLYTWASIPSCLYLGYSRCLAVLPPRSPPNWQGQGDPGRCSSDFGLTNFSVKLNKKILDRYFGFFSSGPFRFGGTNFRKSKSHARL